jgi:hypothetical protein
VRTKDCKIASLNSLRRINCLQYYKPWELLPQEEELIKSQITAAEAQVRQEEEDFANRYPHIPRKKSSVIDNTNVASIETVGKPRTESPSVSKVEDTTNDTPVQVPQEQETSEKQSLEEQNGEVVVENEEDTVIY